MKLIFSSYVLLAILFNIVSSEKERQVNISVWKLAIFSNKALVQLDEKKKVITGGMGFEIFTTLQKKLKFSYELVKPMIFLGNKFANGSWNGIVGQLKNKEADFSYIMIIVTYERFDVVSFSPSIFYYRLTFVVKAPQSHSDWTSVIKPLCVEIWIAISVILPIFSLILHKAIEQEISIEEMSIYWPRMKTFWILFGTLAYQGANLNTIRRFPSRFLIGIWLLSVLVLIMSYSGNLISFLTCPTMEIIPTTFPQLAEAVAKGKYPCGITGRPSLIKFINESNTDYGRLLLDHIILNNHYYNYDEGLEEVLKGNFAYIQTDFVLNKISRKYGLENFMISHDSIFTSQAAYVMRKDFLFRKDVNHIITRLYEAGISNKVFYSWKERDLKRNEESFQSLKINDLLSPFVLLICGLTVSFVCFLIEIFVANYKHCYQIMIFSRSNIHT